jgi:type III secretory pathway component EscU
MADITQPLPLCIECGDQEAAVTCVTCAEPFCRQVLDLQPCARAVYFAFFLENMLTRGTCAMWQTVLATAAPPRQANNAQDRAALGCTDAAASG